jgi:hypothetical protein
LSGVITGLQILNGLDVYTRVEPGEYVGVRDWAIGAALVAGTLPPGAAGETSASENVGTAVSRSEAWGWGWARRGAYFNEQLGANLDPAFPTIDSLADSVVTSIKSIDLNAATYQDAGRLTYRLNNYVDKLATWDGARFNNVEIKGVDVTGRILSLAIPKGSINPVQRAAIEAATVRAQAFDVDLLVTEF